MRDTESMGMRRLEFDDHLSGLLVDGAEATPFVGATLRLTRDKGITVEVPYVADSEVSQFSHVQSWFKDQSPPKNMLLVTQEGTVSLFDIAWSGYSENWGAMRTSVGTMRPALAVLGNRRGELTDPLLMTEMHSRLDGLNDWARHSAVESTSDLDDQHRIQAVTMSLGCDDGMSWRQGDATLTIRARWSRLDEEDGYNRQAIVGNNVHIESTFSSGPMPFWEHFTEQRKVANLMVFLFGRPLSFREHKVRDDLFASVAPDGRMVGVAATEVLSRHTYRERHADVPSRKDLWDPIAYMAQVGIEGLETWSGNYQAWERFILPSASVLGQKERFLEDVVVSTSMSIEAAGGILGPQDGEQITWSRGRRPKPTTATYVYRCLAVLDVKWPERIANRAGMSRAIARNYNDVKHYDRGDFPNFVESHVVSEVNQMIVRLLAVHITGRGAELLAPYRTDKKLYDIGQVLDGYKIRVDEAGRWHRESGEGPRSEKNSATIGRDPRFEAAAEWTSK